MSLISRASAAWGLLWGGESRALVRGTEQLIDLPIRRRASADVSRGTSFRFIPSLGTRKGVRAGTWDLLEAYNEIPALRTCVDLLAPAAARIAYELYRVKRPKERRNFERLARALGTDKEQLRRAMVDSGDLQPEPDHPAAAFVMRGAPAPMLGYPVLSGFEARELLYKYALLAGESFVIVERRGVGQGIDKRGLPWGNVPVVPTAVSALPTYREPWYVVRDADGLEQQIPAQDVLYRREINPRDPYGRGTGAAHSLHNDLDLERSQVEHMAEAWDAGTVPPVLIVGDFAGPGSPGTGPAGPFGLNEDETAVKTQRMLQDWQRSVDRNHPYFMPGVDADGKPNVTVHDLSRTMQEMEGQASRSATWSNIAQVIGRIPPELRGVTQNSNRATAQAGWYLLQTGVLVSLAEKECCFIRERILPEWADETLEVDYVSPVDKDWEYELRVMQSRPQSFMMDEWRKKAGEEALPDGKGQIFIWSPADVPVKDPSQDPFAGAPSAVEAKGKEPAAGDQNGATTPPEGEGGGENEAPAKEEEEGIGRAQLRGAPVAHGSAPAPGQALRSDLIEHVAAPEAQEIEAGAGDALEGFEGRAADLSPGVHIEDRQAGEPVRLLDKEARPHGLLPVPGQDQLDSEAALRGVLRNAIGEPHGVAGDGAGSEGSAGTGAIDAAVEGFKAPVMRGRAAEGGQEGAVVELRNEVHLGEGRESGFGQDDCFHAASLVPTPAEVNGAASYVTLDRIAAAMEPRLRDLLLGTMERARSRVSEGLLVQAIEDGNAQRVIQLLGGKELARDLRRAQGLLGEVFKAAGEAASASLAGQLGREVVFSGASTRALSWAPQRSEDLAAWVRQSIEETGRHVLDHGKELAWSAATTAGAVMLTYGLASYLIEDKDGTKRRSGPAFAVLSHREALAAGEAAEVARAAAESYRGEMLAHRAGMFGGDQSYAAAQAGQGEAWKQAKDKGLLPDSVKRYWVTRGDRRVCPVCDGLHGQKRGLDEPFTSAADGESYTNAGPYDGPHEGCRCALLIVGLRGGA